MFVAKNLSLSIYFWTYVHVCYSWHNPLRSLCPWMYIIRWAWNSKFLLLPGILQFFFGHWTAWQPNFFENNVYISVPRDPIKIPYQIIGSSDTTGRNPHIGLQSDWARATIGLCNCCLSNSARKMHRFRVHLTSWFVWIPSGEDQWYRYVTRTLTLRGRWFLRCNQLAVTGNTAYVCVLGWKQ